jgi:hypothetical protein
LNEEATIEYANIAIPGEFSIDVATTRVSKFEVAALAATSSHAWSLLSSSIVKCGPFTAKSAQASRLWHPAP